MVLLGRKIAFQQFPFFLAVLFLLIFCGLGYYLGIYLASRPEAVFLANDGDVATAEDYRLLNSGNLLYLKEKPDEAANYWREALNKKGDHETGSVLLNNLGVYHLEKATRESKSAEKIKEFRQAVALFRDAYDLGIEKNTERVLTNLEIALNYLLLTPDDNPAADMDVLKLAQELINLENETRKLTEDGAPADKINSLREQGISLIDGYLKKNK